MKMNYDVVIIGGGVSGTLLALNILKSERAVKVAILEQQSSFSLKVGESTSDIATLLLQKLGIQSILNQQQAKSGLRFLFNHQQATLEFSSPVLKGTHIGYHLNRQTFDEDLLEEAKQLGAVIYRPVKIETINCEAFKNTVVFFKNGERFELKSRWLVDASGRARILKSILKWPDLPLPFQTGAIMAHFKGIKSNQNWDLPQDEYWEEKSASPRAYSTIHFMRKQAWWWLIRVDRELTSIGYVYDVNKHQFDDPELIFDELLRTDPDLSEIVDGASRGKVQYFSELGYISSRLYGEGQVLIGDSGAFTDPFLSPGLEMICQQSLILGQLITEDVKTLKFNEKAWKTYNSVFLKAYQNRVFIYQHTYDLMAEFEIFTCWLRFANFAYFGTYIFPAIKFNSKLKKPFVLNKTEGLVLKLLAKHLKRMSLKRGQSPKYYTPDTVLYSGISVPKGIRFYWVPFKLLSMSVYAYVSLVLNPKQHRLSKHRVLKSKPKRNLG